jgi:ABC-2 type transport system ATP-binding protein
MQLAIESIGLQKHYRSAPALYGIDVRVPANSIYGLLGPNGAGKTTFLRLVLGLTQPSGGQLLVWDAEPGSVGAAVGSALDPSSLYANLTVGENLDVARRLWGLSASEIVRVLDVVDLGTVATQRCATLSTGQRQRLTVARALLGNPKLLLLDEPTNGMDPVAATSFLDVLVDLNRRQGTTIVLCSHNLLEVGNIAIDVGILIEGRLGLQGRLADLQRKRQLLVGVDRPADAKAILIAAGMSVTIEGDHALIAISAEREPSDFASEVNYRLVTGGVKVHRLTYEGAKLSQLYGEAIHGAGGREC